MYGKSIELFLVNGDPNGLVTAELSNWNGKAIKIPRAEIAGCNREDLKGVGVYILFCQEEEMSCYIGEAENILLRLNQHLRDYQSGKEKYYWNKAVVLLGRDLNKAHISYNYNYITDLYHKKRGGGYRINLIQCFLICDQKFIPAFCEYFLQSLKVVIMKYKSLHGFPCLVRIFVNHFSLFF